MKSGFKLSMTAVLGLAAFSFASLAAGTGRHWRRRQLSCAAVCQMGCLITTKATGVKINYQSVGSGAGIKQIEAKTVDFGASDAPLKDEELKAKNLVQFPMVIGGVVPVVNIKGIAAGQLKLSGQVLGDIYLGKITKWTDPAHQGAEPYAAFA